MMDGLATLWPAGSELPWLRPRPAAPPPGIERETAWRRLAGRAPTDTIRVSRWLSLEDGRCEVLCEKLPHHLVSIALRQMRMELTVDGRLVHRGRILPGSFHVTPPGCPARAVFQGGADMLHLHLPDAVILQCLQAAGDGRIPTEIGQDPVVERLSRALQQGGETGGLHIELICLGLMARILAAREPTVENGRRVSPLPSWRLARVTGLIDANLEAPLGLAELAAAAGLTRMHFAAQFRAATGASPHDFVRQRRIERAQSLLSTSDMPVVEVALSTGFQTQSHFTTVFKRQTGTTPAAWRRSFSTTPTERIMS